MAEDIVIKVRGLKTQFGAQIVHDDLDLDIHAGQVVGIVGGSGTGKSVLLRTILGLNTPREGDIEVLSENIRQASNTLQQRCGVLFQNGALFSSLTVAENIQVPMREHLDLSRVLMDELAALKISMVGLPPDAGPKQDRRKKREEPDSTQTAFPPLGFEALFAIGKLGNGKFPLLKFAPT